MFAVRNHVKIYIYILYLTFNLDFSNVIRGITTAGDRTTVLLASPPLPPSPPSARATAAEAAAATEDTALSVVAVRCRFILQ